MFIAGNSCLSWILWCKLPWWTRLLVRTVSNCKDQIILIYRMDTKFTVKQTGTLKHLNIKLHHQKFWIKVCTCSCDDLLPGALLPRKQWHLYKKIRHVLWFNRTKSVIKVQRCLWMESAVPPPSKPSIYAFYKQFCEIGCLCKGKAPFAGKCMDRTGILTWFALNYQ
jgi:hypothetical protein